MKTNPNINRSRNGAGQGGGKSFHNKDKPKNDRFFKKKFDKPKRDGGPAGKPWKRPGGGGGGREGGADDSGRVGKFQPRGGKPFQQRNKPSQGMRQRGGGGGANHGQRPRGGPGGHNQQRQQHHQGQNLQRQQHHQGRQNQQHRQQQQHDQRPSLNLDALFTAKPEKLDYCLAPERLEAQARAIKRYEKEDREEEHQRKQSEKQRKHKMMTMKTKKGQPVMQGRMELLYEKVQKMVGQG